MIMERNDVLKLLKEQGYPEFMLEKTADKVAAFEPIIATAFKSFCAEGKVPDIVIEGYDYNILVSEFSMKPVGAFITLDWLVREPEKAKEALIKGIK